MSKHHRKQQANSYRQEPIGRCAFTGARELISQMVRSNSIDPEGPVYFSSFNALMMYKHLHGISQLVPGDPEGSHQLYMDTLKKGYPSIYKRQFGDNKESYHNTDNWNDDHNVVGDVDE